MTHTTTTKNPHGYEREVLVEEMLRQMAERGEPLPDSRPAEDAEG